MRCTPRKHVATKGAFACDCGVLGMIGPTADGKSVVVTIFYPEVTSAALKALTSLHEPSTEREDIRDVPVRESEEVGTVDPTLRASRQGIVHKVADFE